MWRVEIRLLRCVVQVPARLCGMCVWPFCSGVSGVAKAAICQGAQTAEHLRLQDVGKRREDAPMNERLVLSHVAHSRGACSRTCFHFLSPKSTATHDLSTTRLARTCAMLALNTSRAVCKARA